MDGRALTALELSLAAGVTPQTTSSHLAKLLNANLLAVEKQGRHRYYRLASRQVAQTLETIMALTSRGPARHRACVIVHTVELCSLNASLANHHAHA